MDFLRNLLSKKESIGVRNIAGIWIHQENLNTFYHHFYFVGEELHMDTFQVVYPNVLGVQLKASTIKWNGSTLKVTQVSPNGFRVHSNLNVKNGEILIGTVKTDKSSGSPLVIKKLPYDIAQKEIENLKGLGASLASG